MISEIHSDNDPKNVEMIGYNHLAHGFRSTHR